MMAREFVRNVSKEFHLFVDMNPLEHVQEESQPFLNRLVSLLGDQQQMALHLINRSDMYPFSKCL